MANHDITEDTECKHFTILACYQHPKKKSKDYVILTRTGRREIARINWYTPWRQYCLFPSITTVWSSGCLADIQQFLDRLNEKKGKR